MTELIRNQVIDVFSSIFKSLSNEFGVEVSRLAIGVEYRDNGALYYLYKDGKKHVRLTEDGQEYVTIKIEEHVAYWNKLLLPPVKMIIDNKGASLASEFNCHVSHVDIIMAPHYTLEEEKQVFHLPKAVIRKNDNGVMSKVKVLDIENAF